jgi:hypothetical protein
MLITKVQILSLSRQVSGNGDLGGLTPGRLSGRVLTSSATGAQALSHAAIALVEPRKHRAQFTSAVETWNMVAPHIEHLALLVAQWPSLGIRRARPGFDCI